MAKKLTGNTGPRVRWHGFRESSLADFWNQPDFPTPFQIFGRPGLIEVDRKMADDVLSKKTPLLVDAPDVYLFGKNVWRISEKEQCLNQNQVRKLLLDHLTKEEDEIEYQRRRYSEKTRNDQQEPIPREVKISVWQR